MTRLFTALAVLALLAATRSAGADTAPRDERGAVPVGAVVAHRAHSSLDAARDEAPLAVRPRIPLAPPTIPNPALDRDFADPDVLRVGDTYYAYATNSRWRRSGWVNVQVARSSDLVHWDLLEDALPVLPAWARLRGGSVWAPGLSALSDGNGYLLYFTARHDASSRQCIGVATSGTPEGPFTPVGADPLVCQLDEGGSIDASSFLDDDGTRYLLWKNEGNTGHALSTDTWIYIQPLAADGLSLEGEPTRLIRADKAWEGPLIEAPTLWKRGGAYYLFYSGNEFRGEHYAVGYAVASSPLGPYHKPTDVPLLATGSRAAGAISGPGGQTILPSPDGRTWLVYHAWDASRRYRPLHIDELVWDGDRPVVEARIHAPQSAP